MEQDIKRKPVRLCALPHRSTSFIVRLAMSAENIWPSPGSTKRRVLIFLDEISLAAARQVNPSRLKIKTRLFVDQGLGPRLKSDESGT